MFLKKLAEYGFLWLLGGSLYYSFEMIFRGFSHWTMFVLGGICLLFIYIQGKLLCWQDGLFIQILRSVIFVTSMEFITGIIVNKWLMWSVWDYSRLPFQLFGQICLPFSIIFSGLCLFGILLTGDIDYWIFGEEKPHYHIL